jgi:hypothetical protein
MTVYVNKVGIGDIHHLPEYGYDPVENGMTLRQALKALRDAGQSNFGNIGGATYELSDGTRLCVELKSTDDGNSRLMSSQEIVRYEFDGNRDRVLRKYDW